MYDALSIIHIIVSILLIVTILLQQKGASLGFGFGGSDASFEHIRRGPEKKLYQITMVLALAFIILSSLHLFN